MATAVPPVMVASPVPPASRAHGGNVPPPIIFGSLLEILPESEYFDRDDPEWLTSFLTAFNRLYAIGHNVMTIFLCIILMIGAPFVGMFAAAWAYCASLARTVSVSIGRHIADELGYGEITRTKAQYTAWKRTKLNLPAALRLPVTGSRPSSRMLVLNEQELGNMSTFTAVPGALGMFNRLFSWGFMFTVVLVTFCIFLLGPFIGMFVACFDVGMSLLRSFSRSEGRLVADVLGISVLIDQQIAYMRERMAMDTEHSTPAAYLAGSMAAPVSGTNNYGIPANSIISPLATPFVQYSPGTMPPAAYPSVYQAAPAMAAYNQDPSAGYPNA